MAKKKEQSIKPNNNGKGCQCTKNCHTPLINPMKKADKVSDVAYSHLNDYERILSVHLNNTGQFLFWKNNI